jgi:hypothetical protein
MERVYEVEKVMNLKSEKKREEKGKQGISENLNSYPTKNIFRLHANLEFYYLMSISLALFSLETW